MSGLRPIPIDNTASSHKLQKFAYYFQHSCAYLTFCCLGFTLFKQFSLKKLKKSVRSRLSSVRWNKRKFQEIVVAEDRGQI